MAPRVKRIALMYTPTSPVYAQYLAPIDAIAPSRVVGSEASEARSWGGGPKARRVGGGSASETTAGKIQSSPASQAASSRLISASNSKRSCAPSSSGSQFVICGKMVR
jgi:hypothetical protein